MLLLIQSASQIECFSSLVTFFLALNCCKLAIHTWNGGPSFIRCDERCG